MSHMLCLPILALLTLPAAAALAQTYPSPTLQGFHLGAIPTVGVTAGNQTPVAGSAMKIDWLWENSTFPLQGEAGIWPTQTYSYFGVSKEFTAASTPGSPAGSPLATLFSYANNNGSTGDVAGIIGDAIVRQSNGTVFGGNLIARTGGGGLTNTKLVGLEVDVQPSNGDVVTNGAGIFVNAFNVHMPVSAIAVGGGGGGTFGNGLVLNNIATSGAGLAPNNGATMGSMVNTSPGTFTQDAIILGNTQRLRMQSTAGANMAVYGDSNNNIRLVSPGVVAVRNGADANSAITLDPTSGVQLNLAGQTIALSPDGKAKLGWNNGSSKFAFIYDGVTVASLDVSGNLTLKGVVVPSGSP